jgi:hypothetical protein
VTDPIPPGRNDATRPLRAADGMHVEWVEGEAVVLDPQSGELHYLNESAALVFALIQESGFSSALAELKERFADTPNFEAELDSVIADMVAKGLLVDG